MTEAVEVPEGLAALPPGPALAAVLAGINLAAVANNELLPMLRAQSRQAAHEQARLLAVVAEVSRAKLTFDDREVARLPHPHPYCADEVRAALAWSRRAAEHETGLAEHTVHGLPLVFEAFLAGEIDKPKVRVFSEHLGCGLTDAQVQRICAVIVPLAGRLTTGQIAARLRRMILAIDPRHYERRYRKALRDRCVIGFITGDGTATISVSGLSPAEVAAALERIDLLAMAARRAGHPSTLDQIRVDIVAGLLDGTLHHLDRDAIITYLIAHRSAADDAPVGHPEAGPPGADGQAGASQMTSGDTDGRPGGASPDTDGRPDAGAADGSSQPGGATDQDPTDHHDTDHHDITAGSGRTVPADPTIGGGESGREDQRVGVEVRVELSTLLGHDEHPGEIPGWGPITAQHARDTVARQRRAEWRFAVTDDGGRLVFDGLTRRRPSDLERTGPGGRCG